MKTIFCKIFIMLAAIMPLASCAQNKTTNKEQNMNNKKVLIAYFSRADENYNVGYIKKGNTEIIAEIMVCDGVEQQHIAFVEVIVGCGISAIRSS